MGVEKNQKGSSNFTRKKGVIDISSYNLSARKSVVES